jgi:hypothetical protein
MGLDGLAISFCLDVSRFPLVTDAPYSFVNQDSIVRRTMSSPPEILVNDSVMDSVDKQRIEQEIHPDAGTDSDQNGSEEDEAWWRTFKLWKVNMRGLIDDNPSLVTRSDSWIVQLKTLGNGGLLAQQSRWLQQP